jgi:adenine phosphoribosyltransferase
MNATDRIECVRDRIRDVPDFPKPGILFKDITPALADPRAFRTVIDLLAERYQGERLDRLVGMESRGFIFGAALADRLGVGFSPIRKKGKLPADVVSVTYSLEYGTDTLELHRDALSAGQRTLVIDDLLATGGTARAAVDLVRSIGGVVVACAFVIELGFLKGREKLIQKLMEKGQEKLGNLNDAEVFSLILY